MNILYTGLYMQNYFRSKDMEITNEVRQIIFRLRTKMIILMAERGWFGNCQNVIGLYMNNPLVLPLLCLKTPPPQYCQNLLISQIASSSVSPHKSHCLLICDHVSSLFTQLLYLRTKYLPIQICPKTL